MERLTIVDKKLGNCICCNECNYEGCGYCNDEHCCETAIERLVSIEDILGPTYDLSRLKELVEADREGRIFVLPIEIHHVHEYTMTIESTLAALLGEVGDQRAD